MSSPLHGTYILNRIGNLRKYKEHYKASYTANINEINRMKLG